MFMRNALLLGLLISPAVAHADTPSEFKGHTALVYSVAFSPDGKLLATGSFDNSIKLWDFAAGKEARTLTGHTAPVYCVAWSPDGKPLASGAGNADKSVRLWDPAAGKETKNLGTHGNAVYSVAFSPD